MRGGWRGVLYVAVVGLGVFTAARVWPTAAGDRTGDLSLRIWKQRHEMWLQENDKVLRKFQVALGKNPAARKLSRGDGRTPLGTYYICEKRPRSRFRHFLGISYPNLDDAERAFAERLITADQWADIFFANLERTTPPWSTLMGGRVGIHGYGGRPYTAADWTEGCIAVSNADIDYLYDRVPLGTRVVISE
jgi:murein L,D-transpeptidase YafK